MNTLREWCIENNRQDLIDEWHPTKNGSLSPDSISRGSSRRVWWLYSYDVPNDYPVESLRGKHFDFEWQVSPNDRTKYNTACPFLNGRKIWVGFNDAMTVRPDLLKYFNPTKNSISLSETTIRSNNVLWWIYPYDVPDNYPVEMLRGKHFDFEWQARIADVSMLSVFSCPFLNGRVWPGFNDLATLFPDIAQFWHPTKNGDIKPDTVSPESHEKAWWMFPYDVPDDYPVESIRGKHFDFEWEGVIRDYCKSKLKCPYLSGIFVWPGFNDLATVRPEYAKQWHPSRNGELSPDKIASTTRKKVWWLFPYDVPDDYPVESLRGKHFDFEWQAYVSDRVSTNGGCPFLSGRLLWTGFNDLQTVRPDLAEQWNYSKNGGKKPSDVCAYAHSKYWWLYPYDVPNDYPVKSLRGKHFDFEWEATVANRMVSKGCPFLYQSLWVGFNDLETRFPDIAKEWHPTKNGNLKPSDFTFGSAKKVWWHLNYYDPVENKYTAMDWQQIIANRTLQNQTCPSLSASHLEQFTHSCLQKMNVAFEAEYNTPELGFKRFDVYIETIHAVIELDGIQHFTDSILFFEHGGNCFEKRIQYDNEKNEYCLNNGICILRIPYTYDSPAGRKIMRHIIEKFIKTRVVPDEIIGWYSKFDFSNYVKIAKILNNNLMGNTIIFDKK